jgi:hypothetical protein
VADLGAVMAAVEEVAAAAVEANNPDAPGEVAAAGTTKTGPLNAQEKRYICSENLLRPGLSGGRLLSASVASC